MVIDPKETSGKRLAIVAWGKDENGADDVAVFTGIAEWDGAVLRLLRNRGEIIAIPQDLLPRLQRVNDEVKETLMGSEFCISVTVGNIDSENIPADLVPLGLKWPAAS